jgi:spermidine synthase
LWEWAASPQAVLAKTHETARLLLDLYLYVPLFLILPPTLLMGASFPFLQQATQTDLGVLGRRVGWLQVANIAGSTLGAVVTGVLLLHWIGSSWTLRLLVALSVAFPLLLARLRPARAAVAAAVACLAAAAAVPSSQRLWARLHGTAERHVIQDEDGSGVSVLRDERLSEGWRTTVFVSGLGQSGLPYGGYHTVLGALPVLVHPAPLEVAVIGLGSGDTAFAVGARPETRRIDCIEIVACQRPTLEVLARRNPYPALAALLSDPRVRHVAGDGRAFLMKGGTYDVIEADALRPGSAYAGNLYSSEYFALLRRHLKPGGLAVSWSPTPRTRDTFVSVFPHVVALEETLLGSNEPIPFDREGVRARLRDPAVRAHFERAGIDIERVFRGVLKRAPGVYGPAHDRSALADLNTDLFPRDEYLAGERLRPAAAR